MVMQERATLFHSGGSASDGYINSEGEAADEDFMEKVCRQ